MAVVVHVTLRGVTPAQYDAVRERAGWIEQPPTGGISHTTWWEDGDCHNIDAWESEEAFAAFGEQRLGPALAAVGIAAEPEVMMHPAHEVYTPRAGIVAPTAAPTIGAVDNVAVIRSGYEAFARGDVPSVLGLFDAGIKWYAPDSVRFGGHYTGPAEVAEFFSKLPENYAELHVEPSAFVDRADTVVAMGHHRGRSAAGVTFDIPWVHVWTLSKGKATSFTEYFDTVKMNTALGLVSQSATQEQVQHV
jgi:ketosteroid isomerase-like protein